MTDHVHEHWMIREDSDGQPYCMACGENVEVRKIEDGAITAGKIVVVRETDDAITLRTGDREHLVWKRKDGLADPESITQVVKPDDAARARAEREYWANPNMAASLPGYVGPFMAGAAWQRAQIAARRDEVVTTVEQLAALPLGTVMRSANGHLVEIGTISGKTVVWFEGWRSFDDAIKHLAPLTVLHRPVSER